MFDSLSSALSRAFEKFRGPRQLTEENIEEGLRVVRQALLEADVQFQVARDFIQKVKARALGEELIKSVRPSEQIVKIFQDELTGLMGPEARLEMAKQAPTIVLVAGLQGSGKTTTCAKLALFFNKKKFRPLLVAADLQRPAAVEQLRQLGKQLNLPVYSEEKGRASGVCQRGVEEAKRQGCDLVILDTAGRLHVDDALMSELAEVKTRVQPHHVVFVCDAMTGQDAVNSAKAFHEKLNVTGVILTKIDGDTRGGAAMSVKAVTGAPILFVGTGEKPSDLEEFHPDRIASRILGMGDIVSLVEKAKEVVDEEKAAEDYEKLMGGSFTLEDMYRQIQMVKKLGPLQKVMGMLPGMGGMKEMMGQVDEKDFARMEAIFSSMTPYERRHPDEIDGHRRQRIALGSGNPVSKVNDLLKSHKFMKKQMKGLGKMGGMSAKEKKRMLQEMQRRAGGGKLPPGF